MCEHNLRKMLVLPCMITKGGKRYVWLMTMILAKHHENTLHHNPAEMWSAGCDNIIGKIQFKYYVTLCTQRDKPSVIIKCIEYCLPAPPPPPRMITLFGFGNEGGAIVIIFSYVTKYDYIVLYNIIKNVMSILVGSPLLRRTNKACTWIKGRHLIRLNVGKVSPSITKYLFGFSSSSSRRHRRHGPRQNEEVDQHGGPGLAGENVNVGLNSNSVR